MANPNIVNVTSILGNTSSTVLTTNANPFATAIVSNPSGSNKVYKINTLLASNQDGANAADISVSIFSQDDLGGTGVPIAYTISVPADASLVILDKNKAIYLLEDKSIGATASVGNVIAITCSWEEIS